MSSCTESQLLWPALSLLKYSYLASARGAIKKDATPSLSYPCEALRIFQWQSHCFHDKSLCIVQADDILESNIGVFDQDISLQISGEVPVLWYVRVIRDPLQDADINQVFIFFLFFVALSNSSTTIEAPCTSISALG